MSQHDPYGPTTGPLRSPAPPPPSQPGYGSWGADQHGYDPHGYDPHGYDVHAYDQHGYDQHGYDEHGYDEHGYDQQGYGYPAAGSPPPGYDYGYDVGPQRTNVMAILGLVFAFVCSPLGIVFSAIGLRQIRRRGEKGRGLALTGLILSILFVLIGALVIALAVSSPTFRAAYESARSSASSAAGAATEPSTAPGGTADAGAGAGSGTGVASACHTIIPALMNLEASMQDVHSPAQYSQTLATLESTLRTAAGGASDQQFQQEVAQLNADLDKASAAVQSGKDPSSLEKALADDAAAVGEACATAGVTG